MAGPTGNQGDLRIKDYFCHPDTFFARLFNKDAGTLFPALLILVSAVPGVLIHAYFFGYVRQYVPMIPSAGIIELGVPALISTVLFWTIAVLYFYYLSGSPESETFQKPLGWERTGRIVTCCGYALIPLILAQILGIVLMVMVLPGVAIVPPPTTAYEKYQVASSDFNSVAFRDFDPDRVSEKFQKHSTMISAENAAQKETREGILNITGQVLKNPSMTAHSLITIFITIGAMIWSGLLLIIGLRHALGAPQQTTILVSIPLALIIIVTLFTQLATPLVV